MGKYRALVLGDLRQVGRDPVLLMGLIGPSLLVAVIRLGVPVVSAELERMTGFRLLDHAEFMASFLVLIIPLLLGMMTGLLMLEERDENLIGYYAVTPLIRRGYLLYRLLLPTLLSVAFSGVFLRLSGVAVWGWKCGLMLVLLAFEAPMLALFLAAFAANKVEGLALSKAAGLFLAAPIAVCYVPGAWKFVAAVLPSFWTVLCYVADGTWEVLTAFAMGGAVHLAVLRWLLRAWERRID
jgi:fluoroquinolone transport system permease protein